MAEFENSDIHYAYSSIHQFFDVFGISHAVDYLESSITATAGNKMWKQEVPAHFIFFIEELELLCSAAFILYYNHVPKSAAIVEVLPDDMPDMSSTANFIAGYYNSSIWNNFPRSLTAAQYHNPYKAIKKFCKYMAEPEWKKFFKDFTEYALSKSSIDEIYPPYNIFKMRLHLLQLTEACHLIDVRLHCKKAKNKSGKVKNKKK